MMTNINNVENYGWASAQGPQSCGYITPRILEVLKQLGAKRVLDLGAGNGALCSELAAAGYQVAGVEYDKQGVEVASRCVGSSPYSTLAWRSYQILEPSHTNTTTIRKWFSGSWLFWSWALSLLMEKHGDRGTESIIQLIIDRAIRIPR